jgi:hypothetical protein
MSLELALSRYGSEPLNPHEWSFPRGSSRSTRSSRPSVLSLLLCSSSCQARPRSRRTRSPRHSSASLTPPRATPPQQSASVHATSGSRTRSRPRAVRSQQGFGRHPPQPLLHLHPGLSLRSTDAAIPRRRPVPRRPRSFTARVPTATLPDVCPPRYRTSLHCTYRCRTSLYRTYLCRTCCCRACRCRTSLNHACGCRVCRDTGQPLRGARRGARERRPPVRVQVGPDRLGSTSSFTSTAFAPGTQIRSASAPHRQRAHMVSHPQARGSRSEVFDDSDQCVAGRERRLRLRHAGRQDPDANLVRTRSRNLVIDRAHYLSGSREK